MKELLQTLSDIHPWRLEWCKTQKDFHISQLDEQEQQSNELEDWVTLGTFDSFKAAGEEADRLRGKL